MHDRTLDVGVCSSHDRRLTVLGLPTDRNSSYLRGPARAPAVIREAMASDMGHLTAEDGTDLAADARRPRRRAAARGRRRPRLIEAAAAAAFARGPGAVRGRRPLRHLADPDGAEGGGPAQRPTSSTSTPTPTPIPTTAATASPTPRPSRGSWRRACAPASPRSACARSTPSSASRSSATGSGSSAPTSSSAAWAALPEGDVYISFDLDGLDPAFAPGVSHHEPGGLSVRQALCGDPRRPRAG